jgi:phosphoenolpyruvate synthase/pyruvate phosphate dikinase
VIVWFDEAPSAELVGGKGAALAAMACAGLPVPPGFCIPPGAMVSQTIVSDALVRLAADAVAVRSSAIAEDSSLASFAGVHLSRLNVRSAAGVLAALDEVRASATTAAAIAYRARRRISGQPRIAAVVQRMVWPDVSGIAFTSNPVTGQDRIVIEAAWGLGESIVSGAVTPDRFVLSPDGTVLDSTVGIKDVAVVARGEGTEEVPVDPVLHSVPCIDSTTLAAVAELARRCARLFGRPQDVEWALVAGEILPLQSRPVTT